MVDEFTEEGLEVKLYKPLLNDEQRIKKDVDIRKNILDIVTSLNTGN